uniref:Uncharacterized protein n=1 Tax=Ditylum brightwellii TaxID=49249 RepID=A0A7S4W108_9STRA
MNQRAASLFQSSSSSNSATSTSNKKYSYVLHTKIKSIVIGEQLIDAFPPNLSFLCDEFTSCFLGCHRTIPTKRATTPGNINNDGDNSPHKKRNDADEESLFSSLVLSNMKHLYLTFLETDIFGTASNKAAGTTTKVSSSSSTSKLPLQLPHIDYKWTTLDKYYSKSDFYKTSSSNKKEFQHQQIPWIAFFPLTRSGMKLNVWLEEGLPHKLVLEYGDVAFLRGDVVHSGGFSSTPTANNDNNNHEGGDADTVGKDNNNDINRGNRRCHVFLPRIITDIPMGNEYFEREDRNALLSERYITPQSDYL